MVLTFDPVKIELHWLFGCFWPNPSHKPNLSLLRSWQISLDYDRALSYIQRRRSNSTVTTIPLPLSIHHHLSDNITPLALILPTSSFHLQPSTITYIVPSHLKVRPSLACFVHPLYLQKSRSASLCPPSLLIVSGPTDMTSILQKHFSYIIVL